jgi:hypothetical protein
VSSSVPEIDQNNDAIFDVVSEGGTKDKVAKSKELRRQMTLEKLDGTKEKRKPVFGQTVALNKRVGPSGALSSI